MSLLTLNDIVIPGTPAAAKSFVFVDTATSPGVLKVKHDDGSVVSLEAGGAGGGDEVLIKGVNITQALGIDFIEGAGITITHAAGPNPETAQLLIDVTFAPTWTGNHIWDLASTGRLLISSTTASGASPLLSLETDVGTERNSLQVNATGSLEILDDTDVAQFRFDSNLGVGLRDFTVLDGELIIGDNTAVTRIIRFDRSAGDGTIAYDGTTFAFAGGDIPDASLIAIKANSIMANDGVGAADRAPLDELDIATVSPVGADFLLGWTAAGLLRKYTVTSLPGDGLGPDGDKGDIIVGGTGTTLTIDTDAVTFAKFQQVKENSLLGKDTLGTGDVLELDELDIATVGAVSTDFVLGWTTAGLLRKYTVASVGSGGAGNTLDDAYDQGGAGSGRSIDADTGAVRIFHDIAGPVTLAALELERNPAVGTINDQVDIRFRFSDVGGDVEDSATIAARITDVTAASEEVDIIFRNMFAGTLRDSWTIKNVGDLQMHNNGTTILDTNGNELLEFTTIAAAVNSLGMRNAAAGINPQITVDAASETNVGINLVPRGTGTIQANGNDVYFVTGTDVAVTDGGTGLSVGVDGGIPYFDSTTSMASSAILVLNGLVLGGGAAAAPATLALGTAFQHLRMNSGATAPEWVVDTKSKSITIETPADGDLITMWLNEAAITVLGVSLAAIGGTSAVIDVLYNTSIAVAGSTVIHNDTVASATPEWDVTPSGTAAVPTDRIIMVDVGTLVGSPTQLVVTVHYRENA